MFKKEVQFQKEKEQAAIAEPETPVEPEFPRKPSTGSGGSSGYTVEARLNYVGRSEIINGMALGPSWTTLHFPAAPIGVPRGEVCYGHLPHTDLLAYESAQALRWWFLANAAVERNGMGTLCLETRLIEHKCSYSYEEKAVAAVEPTGRE